MPPRPDNNKGIRALMTRMIAKGCCSVHQQLSCYAGAYPQTLFRILIEKSHAWSVVDPQWACMRDQLSNHILSMFPTPEELCSDEACVILATVAQHYSIDTYEVERSFSDIRRRVKSKPQQTWTPSVADVAAETLLRDTVARNARRTEFVLGKGVGQSAREKARRRLRRVRVRKRFSTAWTVFYSMKSRGLPFKTLRAKEISQEYRQLSPEQLDVYKKLAIALRLKQRLGIQPCATRKALPLADVGADLPLVRQPRQPQEDPCGLRALLKNHRAKEKELQQTGEQQSLEIRQASAHATQASELTWATLQSNAADESEQSDVLRSRDPKMPAVVSFGQGRAGS